MKANNGALKLLRVPDRVVDLMTITKLYTVFEIFGEEIDAVYSFDIPAEPTTQIPDEILVAGATVPGSIH